MLSTVQEAVSRIASWASDVVVDALPRSPAKSLFQQSLVHDSHSVINVRAGADAGAVVLSKTESGLVSLTVSETKDVLAGLIPHLSQLASRSVVLHIAVDSDLSEVLSLRSSVPFVLYSQTGQQAHDHALLASRLAKLEGKAVLHIFHASQTQEQISEVESEKVRPFLTSPRRHHTRTLSTLNGSNGVNGANGTNGHANGNGVNGQANGNGTANGNGEASPATPGSPKSSQAEEETPLYDAYETAALDTLALVRRALRPITYSGPAYPSTLIWTLGQASIDSFEDVAVIQNSLLSPLPPSKLRARIPSSVSRIVLLEQIREWPAKYTPLFLDIVSAVQQRSPRPVLQRGTLGPHPQGESPSFIEVQKLLQKPVSDSLRLGPAFPSAKSSQKPVEIPSHESAYTKVLDTIFGERLAIENHPDRIPVYGDVATRPEFALGRIQADIDAREQLVKAVRAVLQPEATVKSSQELSTLLSKWLLVKDDTVQSRFLAEQIVSQLADEGGPAQLRELQQYFPTSSRWIIGSDAWSYDLGASGLHHLIASGLNVNLLIIDSTPYTRRDSTPEARLKKDAGLYAMNHGDVYVGSVAIYSSYGQVLQTLVEADKFKGPSVVVAYLPYEFPGDSEVGALQVLKETKLAVDSGYWPLYRWDPSKEQAGQEPFSLDSEAIKADLEEFLDRQNHLSQLVRSTPNVAADLVGGLGESLKEARRKKAQQAYDELLNAMDGPPLLVLYASDGGTAEKVAKRLAARGKARGLATRFQTMDSFPLTDLATESHVAFVTSTQGQGEPPQNGRDTFKAINAAIARGEKPLEGVKYSIFGLGDSHYWPRPEDKHYYNKPGKDLDAKLETLGGERFADLGLGDDQDADGPQTGYKLWEPLVWKALGVDSVEVKEAEPEPINNEHIKIASNFLRGTIVEGLQDDTTGALAPSDGQITKFHGIYEQDDRDIRDERKEQGLEPAYSFMVRVRMPGGVCKADQWLAVDRIADEHGNGTFKLTTRQTFQFHGVIKKHLKPGIQAINRALLDTIAACGDVNRNVLCSSLPPLKQLHHEIYEFSKQMSEHLKPRTSAYHEVWLDKKLVAGDAVKDFEPLYGAYYLPRKFKIAVACPPHNDVDIFTNDVGFIAIADQQERLIGFNVTAGGGMGVTHSNKKTYPRLGDVLGFVTVEQAFVAAECILTTQRDHGNRKDRKNARLKYTIDRMGLEVFKAEVEKRAGFAFAPARPYAFDSNIDVFGWTKGPNNTQHYTVFIENGRVQDEPGRDFKTGLREIAKVHKGTFRVTCNQHVIIADVPDDQVPVIEKLLAKYKLDNLNHTGLRLSSSACVAFPTCGLAMAESERYLPVLIDKVEKICEEHGLRNDAIVMRMTGCPNGCARPYVAEVAFIGKSPGVYLMLLGGGYYGQRLNKIYRESVTEPEILAILRPMIKHYASDRLPGERFGDFTIRTGYIAATTSGKEWYDKSGGEGKNRVITA
ncbi:hypothetical protein M422DRAFT_220075 [Sphaerobolus stellatus SS14]|nr:hypothetical protein M422DRAFT_220075 [Sphaerobolus stellatus SS14]